MEETKNPLTSITDTKIAYSLPEAAKATSLSVSLLRKHIRTGELKATKIGRRRLILAVELERYLAKPNRGEASC
jgi:excisionase family DNA binding protein